MQPAVHRCLRHLALLACCLSLVDGHVVPHAGYKRPTLPRLASAPSVPQLASIEPVGKPKRHPPPKALAQLVTAAAGGTFAGGLHAITGPDHLSALLPICVARRWWVAIYSGAYWGLGHGIGAALVGAVCFAVRGALNIDAFSMYMEAIVGLSIIVIGANGVREAREWSRDAIASSASSASSGGSGRSSGGGSGGGGGGGGEGIVMSQDGAGAAVARMPTLLTGILNGVTGSGHLLGVLPALAMPNWVCAGSYLASFGLGTLLAMAGFTAIFGELSFLMSANADDPAMPATLAMGSSIFALCVGAVWTIKAVLSLRASARLVGV